MDLKKNTVQNTENMMQGENFNVMPQEGQQFGVQEEKGGHTPAYFESPAQYNGGPPKHSGVGTLILVYLGIIIAVIIGAALLFFLVIKPLMTVNSTAEVFSVISALIPYHSII